MKIQVSTKVIENKTKSVVFGDTNLMDVEKTTTVAELKAKLKPLMVFPIKEVEKETFYCGNKELKDTDLVPLITGNELEIIIK